MSRMCSRSCLLALVILVASFYLPRLYGQLFFERVEKTHLLYSPVSKEFVYKEKIVGPLPPEVLKNAEEQIVVVTYRTESGRWLHRLEFEQMLPFIYYKNMEVRGLLPLEVDGHRFTKDFIKKSRRVLELRAREMKTPHTEIYPLFDTQPEQIRLLFPKDRFHLGEDSLEFVNADRNGEEPVLTKKFTSALKRAGAQFPMKKVFGLFTVLKPFDVGVFLLDAQEHLFHLQRENGNAVATKVSLPKGMRLKYLKVAESRNGHYCALAVGIDNTLWLLSCAGDTFSALPVSGYDANSMDIKLLFNPLYVTAVFSDNENVWAVVMDQNFHRIASFQHEMSRAHQTLAKKISQILFPFVLTGREESNAFVDIDIEAGWGGLLGSALSLVCYLVVAKVRQRKIRKFSLALLAISGVYGLLALFCVGEEE